MKNLMIIDGSALLNTHFYGALPDTLKNEHDIDKANELAKTVLKSAHGRYVNVISSIIVEIMNLIDNYRCDYCAVVFDKNSKTTFRMQMYKDYKVNRPQKLYALKDQMDLLHSLLKHIGIQSYWSNSYEADDLAGSLIQKFKKDVDTVYFVTKDHDWLQLLDRNVKGILLYPNDNAAMDARSDHSYVPENDIFSKKSQIKAYGKQVVYNEQTCFEVEGVYPRFIPDKKGLAGDSSDNIPGATGIGPVTAVALISAFRTVECLFDSLNAASKTTNGPDSFYKQIKPYGIKRNPYNVLLDSDNDALLSKQLAIIKTDIEYPGNLTNLSVHYNSATIKTAIDFYELYELDDYCHRRGLLEDDVSFDFE